MVRSLAKAKSKEPSSKAKKVVDDLIPAFERNMNNDLNVKSAFDALFSLVSKLDNLRKRGKLSYENARFATEILRKIDCVLQVVF